MRRPPLSPKASWALLVAATAAVFAGDLWSSASTEVWVLDFPLVLGCLVSGRVRAAAALTAVCCVLLLVAPWLAPDAPPLTEWSLHFDRLAGVGMLAATFVAGRIFVGRSAHLAEAVRLERAARETLLERELLNQAILDGAYEFVGLLDVQGRVLRANRAALEFVGADLSALQGQPFWETPWWRGSTAARERVRAAVEQAARGEPVRFETEHWAADGTSEIVDFTLRPVSDGQGRILYLVPEGRRIGEQKRMERSLRASEERFRRMAESIPDVIYTAKADGSADYANERFYDFTDPEPATDGAHDWLRAVHPEERPGIEAEWRAAVARGTPYEARCRLRTRSGTYRWVISRARPFRDEAGRVTSWFGTLTDIHDMVAAEARSAEATANIEALLASTFDPVISIDHRGTILTASASVQRVFGFEPAELIGQGIAALMPEPHRSWHGAYLARYLATGHTFVLNKTRQLEGRHKDGRVFPIELSVARVERPHGPPWFTGILRDISERARSEEERTYLLASERGARMEAERATRAKDEFLATLSHELRAPLNAVLGWTQILRRAPRDEETLAEGLEAIERSARAQAQLIGDMLDVSRIVSGKLQLETQRVPVAPWIRATVQLARPAAAEKGVQLEALGLDSEACVLGDARRLQQIVWNLLSNAVKFTPKGGHVRVGQREHEGWLELTVADDGIGISPEFLPFVFERFQQADASSTRQHGGLGLGLAIVKHLVGLHGGGVEARSAGPGRGATFVVRLPLAGSQRAADPTRPAWVEPDLAGVVILVVDDDKETCNVLRRILVECRARVETAFTAAEALACFRKLEPDLLLSDLSMPEMDGYQLVRAIRALESGTRRVRAVALSALARPEDRLQALRAGFDAHLAKPFERHELLGVLAGVLGVQRMELATTAEGATWPAS